MEKKLTKKDYYSMAIELATAHERADLVKFFSHELELVQRKNSNVKPTKTQIENEKLKGVILDTLAKSDKPLRVGEIISANAWGATYSTSKISSLVTQLKDSGAITRVEIKGNAHFKVVG